MCKRRLLKCVEYCHCLRSAATHAKGQAKTENINSKNAIILNVIKCIFAVLLRCVLNLILKG